jgi:hypothetical protein
MYHSILGLPITFYCKFDYSVRFLNSKNVVSLRKTVDECKSVFKISDFTDIKQKKVPKKGIL